MARVLNEIQQQLTLLLQVKQNVTPTTLTT